MKQKKRFGLCILNYTVTSNHIHLLVHDGKENVIPKSMQLIAGRTGREYNQGYELKESQSSYDPVITPEKCSLRLQNDYFWQVS